MAEPSADAARRERKNERNRAWHAANREKNLERSRQYYADNRDRLRELNRQYAQSHQEELREYKREWYQANNKAVRQRVVDNQLRYRHGLDSASKAALADAQGGRCYLCGDVLQPGKGSVDHWHGCRAHDPAQSCAYCQRGIACQRCNLLIGQAEDDPDLLRKIADNLEAANSDVQTRQIVAPEQLRLDEAL